MNTNAFDTRLEALVKAPQHELFETYFNDLVFFWDQANKVVAELLELREHCKALVTSAEDCGDKVEVINWASGVQRSITEMLRAINEASEI